MQRKFGTKISASVEAPGGAEVKGRGTDKRGRSRNGPSFVQVLHWMMDSQAWLDLSAVEKAAYVQLSRRFDGKNNGKLGLSARVLAFELHVSKDTAAKALNALAVAGFIKCVTWAGFNSNAERTSREYRLTCYRCNVTGDLPKKNPSPATGTGQSGHKDRNEQNPTKSPVPVRPQGQIGGVS